MTLKAENARQIHLLLIALLFIYNHIDAVKLGIKTCGALYMHWEVSALALVYLDAYKFPPHYYIKVVKIALISIALHLWSQKVQAH